MNAACHRHRHAALVGPTASGKSALAVEMARARSDIEIVTVDSMQVYRGMDIGTAKPTAEERAEIPHHLLDIADPGDDFSVVQFQAAARECLAAIEERGHRALLVGGTALYVHAVVDDLAPPGRFPEVAGELEADADTVALHRRLSVLDPLAASRMEPTNRRRVIRALEVTLGSGRPFSSYGPGLESHPPTSFLLMGLWMPRSEIARRIEERLSDMVDAGLVDEVRRLLAHPGGPSRTARQALAYKELAQHVESGTPLEDAIAAAVRRTRRFARRQRVWFRRDPRIRWYGTAVNPVAVLPALLGEWEAGSGP